MAIDRHGRIEPRELEREMSSSYLDYAMSVIVGRALPDVRDGLKPVHRRVLFAMHDRGLQPDRPYVKSANIVGTVMGEYHPHGNDAIYDTLVRLAQDFASRYPLVDGQGNFGTSEFAAAAMRYTEARLARIATEMLRDIDEDTVNDAPTYDDRRTEPLVLPSRFPNLLVNGSSGIAVGMATNMPPHNLGEVIDAVVATIDDPDIEVEGLMRHIRAPDFPTGGIIVGRAGVAEAYRTGRGRVVVRGRAHNEPLKGGSNAIVFTELPYQVNKAELIKKMADLANEKTIPEIRDLRDESGRDGVRVVVELRRDAVPRVVLNKLYKHTTVQTTFGVNAIALVNGVPRTLGLRDLVRHYVDHQREVVTRRSRYRLERAEARAHILEGLLVALENLDAVIALIRGAVDPDEARVGLMTGFDLTEVQARAILDLRLQRLTQLEAGKIQAEYAELQERIAELRAILGDEARVLAIIREELLEIRGRYADERRTEIIPGEGDLDLEDLIAEEEMVISISRAGYIKRLPVTTYRAQGRGGKGLRGVRLKDEDYIEHLFIASTHHYLLFFTNTGKVYRQKVHELPQGARDSRGRHIANVLALREGEEVRAVFATRDYTEGRYLVLATRDGMIKKTEMRSYDTILREAGLIAIQLTGRRRARGGPAHRRRRGPAGGVGARPGRPLPRGEGAADGPGHARGAGDDARAGGPGARARRRPRRRGHPRRDRQRLRQADPGLRLPGQGPPDQGRTHDQGHRPQGRAGDRPAGARGPGAAPDLPERPGDPHHRRVGPPHRPLHRGRAAHEPRRRRRRGGGRVRGRGERRREIGDDPGDETPPPLPAWTTTGSRGIGRRPAAHAGAPPAP